MGASGKQKMIQSSDNQSLFVQSVARAVCRHRLHHPALILLETGRPLALLAAQCVWLAQPVLSLFYPRRAISQFAQLLETPEALSQLMAELETQATEWKV